MRTDVLILGGGLAGLSTAHHLNKLSRLSSLVVEKNPTVGGTAGSVIKDGFTFDQTGHLLHLHDPYGKKLILELLRGNLGLLERSSWIYSRGIYTRYPFQANTHGLPGKIIHACLSGFLKTVHWPVPLKPKPSFRDWSLSHFGEGISRNFMFPYNEKLWRTDLSRMTTEWQGRFVPKPKAGEVLCGALLDQTKAFGYNAAFRYPLRGGTQALCDALAGRLKPGQARVSSPVVSVDLRERVAVVSGMGEVHYSRLVNTLPLAHFLDLAGPLPLAARHARKLLRYNTVYNLNIGVARPKISDKHWIYFPEKKFVFYRVGFPGNFSPYAAPKGTSSMYIEVSRGPEEKADLDVLERQILAGLRSCGLLKASDKILARVWIPIRCAYVIYDFNRTPAVNIIFKHLASQKIESIGRYGGWKYSFMEETILDGLHCARRLAGDKGREAAAPSQVELQPLK